MRKAIAIVLFAIIPIISSAEHHKAEINKPAPGFELNSSKNTLHKLSDFLGKWVILEWINFDCPFVKKHYDSENMQKLQKKLTAKGVVWLSICSSAESKQGHFDAKEINQIISDYEAAMTAYLIDVSGKVGKSYGAKTTPHMYVINPEGKLVYAGAIDDTPSTNVEDVKNSKNYIDALLNSYLNGTKPDVKSVTKPYGCSVKYK